MISMSRNCLAVRNEIAMKTGRQSWDGRFFVRAEVVRRFLAYGMIGCLSTVLDFAVYAFLSKVCGVHYQLANLISVFTSLGNGFLLNYYFNFGVRGRFWRRMGMFYAVGMLGWLLSAGLLWALVECVGMNGLLAKLAVIAVCTVVQFSLNLYFTFSSGRGNGR